MTRLGTVPVALAGHAPYEEHPVIPAWQQAARAFVVAVESGRLDLPLPGSGRTRERWAAFADLAGEDLSLVRLAEGHADAVAILAELGVPRSRRQPVGGVGRESSRSFAGGHPNRHRLAAAGGQAVLFRGANLHARAGHGRCRGRHAAFRGDHRRAYPRLDTWPATGMAGSDTLDVAFEGTQATPVGPPGAYIDRPGFAHGGVGVAACWYGGARAIGRTLLAAAAKRDIGPHARAHLGAVDIALGTAHAALDRAAADIDADPDDQSNSGWSVPCRCGPWSSRSLPRSWTGSAGRWAPGR